MSERRCILGCESKSVLFSLPDVDDVRNRWLRFIFPTIPQQHDSDLVLCARHFTDDCFSDIDEGFIKRLRDGAVPTLFAPGNLSESQPDVCGQSSVCVRDGREPTQKSELSLTLLCYTDTNPTDAQHTVCDSNHILNQEESTDQTSTESLDSVWNSGQQHILNTTPLKKCSVPLMDCRTLLERRRQTPEEEEEEEEDHTDEEENLEEDVGGDDDFIPSDEGSDFDSESEDDTEKNQHKCPQCVKRFDNPYNLKAHMRRIHTNERPYLCSECGKTFKDSGSLKSHQRIHSEEKLQCSYCDKRFNHKPNLILHERVHTGEKPYLCSHCGVSFSRQQKLTFHLRTHTGEKPYQCSQCGKRFSHSKGLRLHRRVHTGEKPFPCNVCAKSFTRSDNLKTHQRLHTGEKPYKCLQCEEAFTQNVLLKLHQKVHTGEKHARPSVRKDSLVQC